MSFIHLIGLSRMKATTMLSVLVLILFSIFVFRIVFKCNMKSDKRTAYTQCYECYTKEASKTFVHDALYKP